MSGFHLAAIPLGAVLLTALQGGIFSLFATAMLTPRTSRLRSFMLFFGLELLALGGAYLLEPHHALKALCTFLFWVVGILAAFTDPIPKRLMVLFILFISVTFSDVLLTAVVSLMLDVSYDAILSSDIRTVGTALLTLVIFFILSGIYLFFRSRRLQFSGGTLLKFLLFPLGQGLLIFALNILALGGMSQAVVFAVLLGLVLCILSDVVILQTMLSYEEKIKLEQTVRMMEFSQEAQRITFEQTQQRGVALAKLRHDYKNHLASIAALLEDGRDESGKAALGLLQEMQKQYDELERVRYCEHSVVNAVLTCKSEEAARAGVVLRTRVALPARLAVEDVHLCSLFSNLLDNALRAAAALPADRRWVEADSRVCGDTLFVNVHNPYQEGQEPHGENGYGLKIVKEIAGQYEGELIIQKENGLFTAIAALELHGGPSAQAE